MAIESTPYLLRRKLLIDESIDNIILETKQNLEEIQTNHQIENPEMFYKHYVNQQIYLLNHKFPEIFEIDKLGYFKNHIKQRFENELKNLLNENKKKY
jgi:hypothetical protein